METCNSTVNTMVVVAGQGQGQAGQKRKRAGKPKVKTGCAVCKIRRVKCGEERPECKRCVKFGMKCEGYPKQAPHPRQLHRALLPRVEQPLAAIITSQAVAPPVRIPRTHAPPRREKDIRPSPPVLIPIPKFVLSGSPFTPRFHNTAEYRYFTLFHVQTALHLSGLYSPNVWSHIVLQASEAEPSIRHAVISIGALEMTSASLKDVRTYVRAFTNSAKTDAMRQQVKSQTEQHHVFALQQYSKAIHEMQKLVSGSVRDCRTALIASLLIICFETYHGNYESAAKQITTGVRLIESRHEMASPPPQIEEELLHAFTRLEIQTMGHSDPFTLAEHNVLKNSSASLLARMPTTFTSSLDARNYFNIIARRSMHYGCALWQSSHQPSSPHLATPTKPTMSHFEHIDGGAPSLLADKGKYLAEVEAWQRAFRPMFDNAKPGTNEFLASRTMQLHYLPVHLTLSLFPSTSEMAYDAYLGLFKEVIEMARLQLTCSSKDPMFAFDLQNVWPLFVVAKKCRDPLVRREAIWLLTEWPRREGIWDSVVAAAVSRWVVSVEEEGMIGGFVEERKRATSVEVKLDFDAGRAEVWCLVPAEDGKGMMRRRDTVIEWEVQS